MAKWYVTGQGKGCLFQLHVVNLFPSKSETWVLVDGPLREGSRWSVILAETCFVCLQIVLKVFVLFSPVHRKEQRLYFSVVLHNISKGFSQAYVPGAFFTFMPHILLFFCYFLTYFWVSQLPLSWHVHTEEVVPRPVLEEVLVQAVLSCESPQFGICVVPIHSAVSIAENAHC